ncbi:MAG: SPW repeat protein [Magnetospirillum sp.]|nr:SPW repeat protein [Magnetospirillum sp.]
MPIGTRTNLTSYWQDWVNLVLGVWLFIAPWALGYSGSPAPAWNSWIFGVVIAVLSIAALVQFALWEEWVNVVIGVWLLISPWVLGFAATPGGATTWNQVVIGIVVGLVALWDALSHRERPRAAA